jgi:hypothetical protein
LIGGLVRLGRRIPPWNQWPEGFWRDPKLSSFVGDMPDIRIGEEYTPALRSLFACEREAHEYLVITPGAPKAGWMMQAKPSFGIFRRAAARSVKCCIGKRLTRLALYAAGRICDAPGTVRLHAASFASPCRVGVNGRRIETFDAGRVTRDECPAEMVLYY